MAGGDEHGLTWGTARSTPIGLEVRIRRMPGGDLLRREWEGPKLVAARGSDDGLVVTEREAGDEGATLLGSIVPRRGASVIALRGELPDGATALLGSREGRGRKVRVEASSKAITVSPPRRLDAARRLTDNLVVLGIVVLAQALVLALAYLYLS